MSCFDNISVDLKFPLNEKKYIDFAEFLRKFVSQKYVFINIEPHPDASIMISNVEREKLQRIFDAYADLNIFMVRLSKNVSTQKKPMICSLQNNTMHVEYDDVKFCGEPHDPLKLPQSLHALQVHAFDESHYCAIKNTPYLRGLYIDVVNTEEDIIHLIDLLNNSKIASLQLYDACLSKFSSNVFIQFISTLTNLKYILLNMNDIDKINAVWALEMMIKSNTLDDVALVINDEQINMDIMNKLKAKLTKFNVVIRKGNEPTGRILFK